MNTTNVILGPAIAGTSLIRRFRVCGPLRVEVPPRYLPPFPRPPHAWIDAMSEARQAGYGEVCVDGQVLRITPDPKSRRAGMRLVSDDPRPGVIRRIGEALGVMKERA